MVSSTELAWKLHFLLLLLTLTNTLIGFIRITLLVLALLLVISSLLLPIGLLISFGIRSLDNIYGQRLGRR